MVHLNGVETIPQSYQGKSEPSTLLSSFLKLHQELLEYRYADFKNGHPVVVDGTSITIASLTAAARYQTSVVLNDLPAARIKVQMSRDTIVRKLESEASIYGVNTGFGGSADSRTRDTLNLGNALFQMQHCGVLPSSSEPSPILPLSDPLFSTAMPESWIRAAILIRMNSLVRGHSGVRWELLEAMGDILRENVIPVVPMRGSISASGDLSPLSYIAGVLTGNPSIRVFDGPACSGSRYIASSSKSLASHGLSPIELQPKEHLGLLNGTAFSAAVSGLALYDAINLALLAQICTAMSAEALLGSKGSFSSFVNEVARPHPGQVETARTINALLASSKLATMPSTRGEVSINEDRGVLKQDRYALRTAPQFIGPQIEDIQAALDTIHQELNSTTDNPLVDSATQTIHDTGNFQAMAVTNAMEKTRLSLHHLGKILFAQATELINPETNKGLPPSLAATDPSLNYHCKGLEISLASYVSELGFLANPVSTHIQSAEMHNQAVNSLALISARATVTSLEILTMLIASNIYILCQAFDLRALEIELKQGFHQIISEVVSRHFQAFIPEKDLESLVITVSVAFHDSFSKTSTIDGPQRIETASKVTVNRIMDYLLSHPNVPITTATRLLQYQKELESQCLAILLRLRELFLTIDPVKSPVRSILGASRDVYDFVRTKLGIRMHGIENWTAFEGGLNTKEKTVGENVSLIFEAIRYGQMHDVVVGMMKGL